MVEYNSEGDLCCKIMLTLNETEKETAVSIRITEIISGI